MTGKLRGLLKRGARVGKMDARTETPYAIRRVGIRRAHRHKDQCRRFEIPARAQARREPSPLSSRTASSELRAAQLILVLALAPAVGVGLCRFAYSLLLPDMR